METNLGRVRGAGVFGSTSTSTTSIATNTVKVSGGIVPLKGDTIINANGDLCEITAVTSTAYTVTKYGSIRGADGASGQEGQYAATYRGPAQEYDDVSNPIPEQWAQDDYPEYSLGVGYVDPRNVYLGCTIYVPVKLKSNGLVYWAPCKTLNTAVGTFLIKVKQTQPFDKCAVLTGPEGPVGPEPTRVLNTIRLRCADSSTYNFDITFSIICNEKITAATFNELGQWCVLNGFLTTLPVSGAVAREAVTLLPVFITIETNFMRLVAAQPGSDLTLASVSIRENIGTILLNITSRTLKA